jgi:hypothetical protein
MSIQNPSISPNVLNSSQEEIIDSLTYAVVNNPILQRALRRLKESQEKENHISHYTKHHSHSTHSKGGPNWR